MLNFDGPLSTYSLIGFLLVFVLFLAPFHQTFRSKKHGLKLWGILFVVLLSLMRLPFLAFNRELEVDESQMLAQAISLKKYWIYWKYVDGLTQGPMTIFSLIIPTWLGLSLDFTTARLLGFVLLAATLFFTFLSFRNLFGKTIAFLTFTPIGLFYILSQGYFSALYNEFFVLFLLSICFWIFTVLYLEQQPKGFTLFMLGFLTGITPFAKLQGVPTALIMILFAALIIVKRSRSIFKNLFILGLGGILFPFFVVAMTYHFGAFDYFWKFYVIGNLEYSGGGTIVEKLSRLPAFIAHSGQFLFLLFSYFLLLIAMLPLILRSWSQIKEKLFLFSFGIMQVIFAFYSIIKPGYFFQHYWQFLLLPLGILCGLVLQIVLEQRDFARKTLDIYSLIWLAVCILPHLIYKFTTIAGYTAKNERTITLSELGKPLIISPTVRQINKYIKAGDDITIWGWKPSYHVESGAAQGTGDVMIYRLLTRAPKQQDYVRKYVEDLNRTNPAVFVDEITQRTLWFGDPRKYSYEKVPEIRAFVDKNYRLVSKVNEERIFLRNDLTIAK